MIPDQRHLSNPYIKLLKAELISKNMNEQLHEVRNAPQNHQT